VGGCGRGRGWVWVWCVESVRNDAEASRTMVVLVLEGGIAVVKPY